MTKGSTLNDCLPCMGIRIPIAISGTFLLTPVTTTMWTTVYRVDAIDFIDTAGDKKLRIAGTGTYEQGGDFALTQKMVLKVTATLAGVPREATLVSVSPLVPVVALPALDVTLDDDLYELHIAAKPSAAAVPFRRGDANVDAKVDLSDAVYILTALFLTTSTTAPPCLAAMDANADGKNDVSDAVYLLAYLFQGKAAPPDPGPAACGTDPIAGPGCGSYSACK
jgi:hypothetical protein